MAEYIEKIKVSDTTYVAGLPNFYVNDKGNLNIETSTDLGNCLKSDGTAGKGKINIEGMDDILFKPGDDMILYSHHRAAGKNDEVAIKVTNGDDYPVKLQLNAANLTITTKDKDLTKVYSTDDGTTTTAKSGQASTESEDEIFDVNINTGKSGSSDNTKGYLKVRARAIDLRCEEHGGISLQPKGYDASSHMNKIKFEHGGGDGLEFGTFNTDKTSIFTNEYRFNKDGIWKMATRETETSDKKDTTDVTTYNKYVKQDDDFYDIIDSDDEVADTEAIIKTANAFNYGKSRHAKFNSDGNIEIGTCDTYKWELATTYNKYTATSDVQTLLGDSLSDEFGSSTPEIIKNLLAEGTYTIDYSGSNVTFSLNTDGHIVREGSSNTYLTSDGSWSTTVNSSDPVFTLNVVTLTTSNECVDVTKTYKEDDFSDSDLVYDTTKVYDLSAVMGHSGESGYVYSWVLVNRPAIHIDSTVANLDEVDSVIAENIKNTKKGAKKGSLTLAVTLYNNATSAITYEGVSCPAGQTTTVMSADLLDVIKLVNYMKANSQGPWAA